jgi:hypothetical protein
VVLENKHIDQCLFIQFAAAIDGLAQAALPVRFAGVPAVAVAVAVALELWTASQVSHLRLNPSALLAETIGRYRAAKLRFCRR